MDKSFSFDYKKGTLALKSLILGFGLVFVLLFVLRIVNSFQGFSSLVPPPGLLTAMMVLVPLIAFSYLSFFLLKFASQLLAQQPLLSGDGFGLTIKRPLRAQQNYAWSDLEHVRFSRERSRVQEGGDLDAVRIYTTYLYIKPQNEKAFKVDITDLDASLDDLYSAFKALAPNLEFLGFGK